MGAGIYWIRNTVNGKFYIGSSVDTAGRMRRHRSYLNTGTHRNQHLQSAWNKYGPSAFRFETVEELPGASTDQLRTIEQWYFDNTRCLDRRFGYNISSTTDCPTRGRKATDEERQRMSARLRGHTVSAESRAKIRAAKLGVKMPKIAGALNPQAKPIKQYTKAGDYIRTWACGADAAASLGVTCCAISKCLTGCNRSAAGYVWHYSD